MSKNKTQRRTTAVASACSSLSSLNGGSDGHQSEETFNFGVVEDENEAGNDDENGSSNGRKRARLNEDGDSVIVKLRAQRAHLPRDTDGYVPGSIVRIQLKHFVTYDFVEFRPGSNLNMIFGPNGTGKSSIACAICIGLNGSPALLGRSADLKAFVKQGYDFGYVELELKGKIGTPNLTIRRTINAKNCSSRLTLNGSNSTGKDINERLADLNVQVGNLCSFLPQDRVSEFAQMSPQDLLKETQRTAGHANLTSWHDSLIKMGKVLVDEKKIIETESKRIVSLEEKQKALEKDVRRYLERREIEKHIELLNVMLSYVEYEESQSSFYALKNQREIAREECRRVEELNRPIIDLRKELRDQSDQLNKERAEQKENLDMQYGQTIASLKANIKRAAGRADKALEKIRTLKLEEKDRRKHIAKAQEEILKFQKKVDKPPSHEPVEPILDKMKEIQATSAELKVKRLQINQAVTELVERSERNKLTYEAKQRELNALENFTNRKVQALERWDRDCADVVKWILANKATNEFAARIDLPAFMGVDMKDQRFASAVEACFGGSQMKTFVTHNESDYREFNRIFIDTPSAVGRKVRVTVWYRPRNEASLAGPPLTPNELQDLKFDGYAIDYIECSEGLKWFFMKELNIHRTPITLRAVDDPLVQSVLTRPGPDGRLSSSTSYVSGNTYASVSRSSYGQRKIMSVTRRIPPARNFVHPSVDPETKKKIEQEMSVLQQVVDELKAQVNALKDEDQTYLDKVHKMKSEHDKLRARQQAVEETMREISSNEKKLATWREKLTFYEQQPSAEEERLKQTAIVEQTVKDRSESVEALQTLIQQMIARRSDLAILALKQLQLDTNLEAINTMCREGTATVKQLKETCEQVEKRCEEVKVEARNRFAVLEEKRGALDQELLERHRVMVNEHKEKPIEERWTPEKIKGTLETENTKLEFNNATDAGIISTYEAREREIDNLRSTHEKRQEKYRRSEERIQAIRNQWYPALKKLVSAIGAKFSAAFERIGCAGEIRISEKEDYDEWSIDIFVKFRNEEPLTQLTGQRQSGGERSLTTIMYLMSLTEQARAPFSLVDEINQGMDQKYERAVHDQLVKVTCQSEAGQYFLITPKLLPFLTYHENMKILCVNNGDWLPESTSAGVGNMKQMIDKVVAATHRPRAGPVAS